MSDVYVKHQKLLLKNHPTLNEKWVQELIANDPSMLGLGDLVLKDKERSQPRAGRLDLLLQNMESQRRYEVELQLGTVDESHIIRTIEYWDVERKRYPQYDHCAVIIAEEITSRFFNIISLFNGHIPLIAIQMQALKMDDKMTLVFTTILDELELGLDDEEDADKAAPADRAYWEGRAGKSTLAVVDKIISILRKIDNRFNLKYNKHYIGLEREGIGCNFIRCVPRKNHFQIDIRLRRSAEMDEVLEQAGFDIQPVDRGNNYKLKISAEDVDKPEFSELCRLAYEKWDA